MSHKNMSVLHHRQNVSVKNMAMKHMVRKFKFELLGKRNSVQVTPKTSILIIKFIWLPFSWKMILDGTQQAQITVR